MTTSPDPLARLPLRVTFDVSLQGPDGGYQPRAIITPRGGLPPGIIEGTSRADALARGAAALMGMPDTAPRLSEGAADRLIVLLRRLQAGANDLFGGLEWLYALARAHALREPRHLFFCDHDPRRPGAKIRWCDVEEAAHDLFATAARATRDLHGAATLLREIVTGGEAAAYCDSPVSWVVTDAIVKLAVVLQLALDALGAPERVVTAGYRALTIELPRGAVEFPGGWVRYQAAQWSKDRKRRSERIRLFGVSIEPTFAAGSAP